MKRLRWNKHGKLLAVAVAVWTVLLLGMLIAYAAATYSAEYSSVSVSVSSTDANGTYTTDGNGFTVSVAPVSQGGGCGSASYSSQSSSITITNKAAYTSTISYTVEENGNNGGSFQIGSSAGSVGDKTAELAPNGTFTITFTSGNSENANANYKVTFRSNILKPVTATAKTDDAGMGSVSVSPANVTPGGSVTFTATAKTDYEFLCWKNGNTQVSTSNPYTTTITENTTLTAYFRSTNSTVYFANTEGGTYTVTGTGINTSVTSSTQTVTKNESLSVSLTATESSGYRFAGWYLGDTQLSAANPWSITLKDYDAQTITARWGSTNVTTTFVPAEHGSYTIGGTAITASTPITNDYSVEYDWVATPATDYHFVRWLDQTLNVTLSTDASTRRTLSETAGHTVTAEFAYDYITQTFPAVTGGVYTVEGHTVSGSDYNFEGRYDRNYTVTIGTLQDWYRFDGWVDGSGNVLSTANSYTFRLETGATVKPKITFYGLSVTFQPAQGDGTYTFTAPGSDSVTVSSSSYTYQGDAEKNYTLTATAGAENYAFAAWYDVTAGSNLSTANPYTGKLTNGHTYKAIFNRTDLAQYQVGSDYYDYLDLAIDAAGGSGKIIVTGNGVVAGSEGQTSFTIPSGVTMVVPYDGSGSVPSASSYKPTFESGNTYNSPSLFKKLTMPGGVSITVDGTLVVNSKMARGPGGSNRAGASSGSYGQLDMESGSSINVNGVIVAYGYITGTGTVTANNGAQVYEGFQILDTPGGTHLTALNGNNNGAFLFNQYSVQNIEVPLTIKAGATETVWTGIYPSTALEGSATLIGSDSGLFRITEGHVIKSYLPAEDRLQFDVFGTVKLGSISLSISSYDFDTTNYNLPISPRINIFIRSGTTTIMGHTILLPDSKMAINEGATFLLDGGKRLLLWDFQDWDSNKHFSADLAKQVKSVAYSPTTNTPAAHLPTKSAEIDVNGTLQVTDGYLYTSSHGANIFSGDRTGKVIIETAYGDYTLKVCVNAERQGFSGKATYEDVAFTSGQLKNGQPYEGTDKEHIKTGNTGGGTGTFFYTAPTDQWYKFTVNYEYNGNTIYTDYIFDGTSSYSVSGLDGLGASASNGTASVSGDTVSVTGVTANSTVTVTGTPKEYQPYFVLDAKNYALYQRFTGNTLSDTVTVGDTTYYVVQAAASNMAFGAAMPAPTDASMGVSAANNNEITWRLANNAAGAVFAGTVPQGEAAQGPVYIYGFYSGYVAAVTENGSTTKYTTLEKAFYALLNNRTYTVTMLADCGSYEDEDGTASLSVPAGAIVTFDLNGHYAKGKLVNNDTLYLELNGGTFEFHTGATAAAAAYKGVAAVTNSGTLTITDSVGGGMITSDAISSESGTNGSAVIRNNATGTMTVTGVTVKNLQKVNSNNYGIFNLGTINALTNVDISTEKSGTCGVNLYNYNTGVIKLISGGHMFAYSGASLFNYGGTINTVDGLTIDGKNGVINRNIRTGAIATGYNVVDSDKGIIDTITNCHFEVGQYAINNNAVINTLSNSTFIAHPDSAQVDTRGNGLATASEGNNYCYTVYNNYAWWYDTNVWKRVDSTSGGYTRVDSYREDEKYRPTIGSIIDCEIYAENTSTSTSHGYALVNYGVIGKIGGTTNIKAYTHPDNAKITTSHYSMHNLGGGIIKSIEDTVNISATGIGTVYNDGVFTTQIDYTYGNKIGGNLTHQLSTYGQPSTINSITCSGTWSCGSYYALMNSGYIQAINAPGLTLSGNTSSYNVLINTTGGVNSQYEYTRYYTDTATASTEYRRVAEYTKNMEKGSTIDTLNGITVIGKYQVLNNQGHIGTLSNVTVSNNASSNNPTFLNGDSRYATLTEDRRTNITSEDYPHLTVSAGIATRYDRQYTYGTPTIDVIDNLTVNSIGQYALRNAGSIGTLRNSSITATTNYALHNSASGPYTERQTVQYYSGTSIFAASKGSSELASHYVRNPATIGTIDNCTIKTDTSTYAAYNVGHIGTIKNSTFQAGATKAAQYALANVNSQELEYTRNLEEVLYVTANSTTACTAYWGTGGESDIITYDYDCPTIDLIGDGNTFIATTTVIANTGIITEINSGTGTLTTITGSAAKGSGIYNYSACLDACTTTKPYTAAASANASGTAGTAVNDDTLLPGAQIGTIKNVYIDANGYGILNGDAGTGKLPTIGEIGEGTEIYAHCTTAGYHAIYNQANAKVASITGGIFTTTKATTNAYKNNNTNTELATVISGGDFKGMSAIRDNAIFEPDNTARQTYPTGKKLSTGTESVTLHDGTTDTGYYYIVDTYTVTFDKGGHGDDVDAQTVDAGQKATKPESPAVGDIVEETVEGVTTKYKFIGWFADAECKTAFDFDAAITANTTVYAKWEEQHGYTVTFDSNGGSAVDPQTVEPNGTVSKPIPDPTKDGYTFKEWQLSGAAYDFATPVTDNITLTAAWRKNITAAMITNGSATYNGAVQTPAVTVKDGEKTLTVGTDYTVTVATVGEIKDAKTYNLTITGIGNYAGEVTTATFTINKADLTLSVTQANGHDGLTLVDPTVTGNTGSGTQTVEYKVRTAADDTYTTTKPTAVGNYTVRVRVAETTNYNAATMTADFEITAHSYGDWTTTTSATCTTAGVETCTCTVSGCSHSETREIAATGHSWGEWTGTTAPTCTDAGEDTRTCAVCGETETREVAALGHDMSAHEAVSATCESAGNSAYWSCVRCGKYFSDAEGNTEIAANSWVIAALGHDWNEPIWNWSDTVSATATFTCKRDNSHTEDVTATISREDSNPAKYVYTATVIGPDEKTYTDTKEAGRSYTITWKDGNGETLKTEQVAYGTTPSYSGATPTKTATAQYTYTFNNTWSPAITSVTGAATYTAQFDSTVNEYTVTFLDEDGETVLQSGSVAYGTIPVYIGKEPTKAATAQFTYAFGGWDREIVAVTSDATYTATYTSSLNQYTITFVDEDGETVLDSQTVKYGDTPEFAGETPTKSDTANYHYEFSGWTPEIAAVTEDATYTATYTATERTYGEPVWTWDGVASATARFTTNDGFTEFALTENATITHETTLEETCETAGAETYTATVTFRGETYTNAKEVERTALGHDYVYSYVWSEDNSSVSAQRVCQNNHSHTDYECVATTSEVTKAASCTEHGEITYTATFQNLNDEGFETQIKSAETPFEHNYDDSEWTWLDNSTAFLEIKCGACGKTMDQVEATVTGPVSTEPTCTEEGSIVYTATAAYNGKTLTDQNITVLPATGHTLTAHPAVSATCTKEGNSAYWSCDICGKFFADADGKNEIKADSWRISATGHSYSVVWTWAEEYSSATATFTCSACGDSHTVTDRSPVYELLTEATEDTPGSATWTATVDFNGGTFTDTQTVEVPYEKLTYPNFTIRGEADIFNQLLEKDIIHITDSVAGTFTATYDKALVIAVRTVEVVDGEEVEHYERLYCTAVEGEENTYAYNLGYAFDSDIEIVVAVKGDLNGDGLLSVLDRAYLSRGLLSETSKGYVKFSGVTAFIADTNEDGRLNVLDRTRLSRALLDPTHPAYLDFTWDCAS